METECSRLEASMNYHLNGSELMDTPSVTIRFWTPHYLARHFENTSTIMGVGEAKRKKRKKFGRNKQESLKKKKKKKKKDFGSGQ